MESNWRPYVSELVGTFILVFCSAAAVCADAVAASPTSSGFTAARPGLVGIALAAGCALAVGLAITPGTARGYLNPAVTLMLWVFKRLEAGAATMFIAVQFLGAAIAGGLVRLLFSFNEQAMVNVHLGTPHVSFTAFDTAGLTSRALFGGIGMELVASFVLTFVIFATLIDPRWPRSLGRFDGLWAGLALIAITLVTFGYTGAAINPARWFGSVIWETSMPALAAQQPYADHMVFWVGPIIGALIAGGIYSLALMPEKPPDHAPAPAPAPRIKK